MKLREYYESTGGSYDDVLARLGSEEMVLKYLRRVPEDETLSELEDALRSGDDENAFRAAHSMKGFCLTLGLTEPAAAAASLTEALRHGKAPEADTLFEQLTEIFRRNTELIGKLD